jgi:hypothetical protein
MVEGENFTPAPTSLFCFAWLVQDWTEEARASIEGIAPSISRKVEIEPANVKTRERGLFELELIQHRQSKAVEAADLRESPSGKRRRKLFEKIFGGYGQM